MTPHELRRLVTPQGPAWWGALALGILASGSAVALLATSMWLITRASEQPPILYLSFAVVGVRAFALGRAFFRYVERLVSHDSVLRQLPRVRASLFDRLAKRAPWGVPGFGRGDMLSRFVRDVDELQFFPLRVILPSVASTVVVALSCALLGVISLASALGIAAVSLLATGVALAVTAQFVRQGEMVLAPVRGELSDATLDGVGAWDVLGAFGAQTAVAERMRAAALTVSGREQAAASRAGLSGAILTVGLGIASALAAVVIAPAAQSAAVTGPAAAVVLLLPIALFDLLAVFPIAMSARANITSASERVSEMMMPLVSEALPSDPDPDIARGNAARVSMHPELRFHNLSARYPGSNVMAVSEVSGLLPAGGLLAVTGESGAGKSTLAQVAVRFLDYTGSFTLDGIELRDMAAVDIRSRIVLIEQRPWLADSTIRGNIQFASPGCSDDTLWNALERVRLADWVRARGGLDAEVGERGELISGGQAQRLGLARGLLSSARILIFDEPTANLDPFLTQELLEDIMSIAPERSVMIITHAILPHGVPTLTLTRALR